MCLYGGHKPRASPTWKWRPCPTCFSPKCKRMLFAKRERFELLRPGNWDCYYCCSGKGKLFYCFPYWKENITRIISTRPGVAPPDGCFEKQTKEKMVFTTTFSGRFMTGYAPSLHTSEREWGSNMRTITALPSRCCPRNAPPVRNNCLGFGGLAIQISKYKRSVSSFIDYACIVTIRLIKKLQRHNQPVSDKSTTTRIQSTTPITIERPEATIILHKQPL